MLLKMNDLKINVPLAEQDDTNCDLEVEASLDSLNNNLNSNSSTTLGVPSPRHQQRNKSNISPNMESFADEPISGSLEDLVTSFDEKISSCFKDFREKTEDIAPVQIRTQEEIMNECQIWWTLTGNFGNILPIDWSKSCTRSLQLNALNIKEAVDPSQEAAPTHDESEEDEELARALDMHSLIVTSPCHAPLQTADQVIQEIDEIMQVHSATSEMTGSSDVTYDSAGEMSYSPNKARMRYLQLQDDPDLKAKLNEATSLTSNEDKLKSLSFGQLMSLQAELESLIQVYNEALVEELALREELEYEKELKNTFISLILNVQNRRRQYLLERKKQKGAAMRFLEGDRLDPSQHPQFVTAVIPFNVDTCPPNNTMLQSLIKILKAVNENDTGVPTLLTDYILNVLCPNNQDQAPKLLML